MTQETKTCQNCRQSFTIEPEDFNFYEKIKVPPPTWCPECRLQRRLMFRNERNLYKRLCDLCKRQIISMYKESELFPVFCQDCWWSDKWNSLSYGRNYDFSKNFFEQFRDLQKVVPRVALTNTNSVNSEYTNYTGNNKNCYLIFSNATGNNENVAYGTGLRQNRDSFDLMNVSESELIYDSFDCIKCYNLVSSNYCFDCRDSYFLEDCRNCQNCIGCRGLRNKQCFIFNKQFSKDEFFKIRDSLKLDSVHGYEVVQSKFEELRKSVPTLFAHVLKTDNCTGDYITNSRRCFFSFDANDSEDSKFLKYSVKEDKSCYDVSYVTVSELGYETLSLVQSYNCHFSNITWWGVQDLSYCELCFNTENSFGSISLRKKQYCILNKQYTKEEYEALVSKIIEHMNTMPYVDSKGRVYKYGEFFPPDLSPFCYNETIAQEYFPLTKEQAISQGYRWKEPEERNYQITKASDQLPDHIKDVPDTITQEIIQCAHYRSSTSIDCNEQCTTAFKIIPEELQFYRRMNLPLPRLCPNCRHYQRLKQRNPLKLWHRKCQCAGPKSENGIYQNTISHQHDQNHCPNEFETSYSPKRKEVVYCEQCYNAEVV